MALTKRHPSEARPNGRSAPKGSVKGKTPPNAGHKVTGKGRSAGKGGVIGKSPSNGGKVTGGKGRTSGAASGYGGSY